MHNAADHMSGWEMGRLSVWTELSCSRKTVCSEFGHINLKLASKFLTEIYQCCSPFLASFLRVHTVNHLLSSHPVLPSFVFSQQWHIFHWPAASTDLIRKGHSSRSAFLIWHRFLSWTPALMQPSQFIWAWDQRWLEASMAGFHWNISMRDLMKFYGFYFNLNCSWNCS